MHVWLKEPCLKQPSLRLIDAALPAPAPRQVSYVLTFLNRQNPGNPWQITKDLPRILKSCSTVCTNGLENTAIGEARKAEALLVSGRSLLHLAREKLGDVSESWIISEKCEVDL